jgi:2-methylcitrate synthase
LSSILLYWHHFATSRKRIETATDDDSIAAHFLHLLHQKPASAQWIRGMHVSLILYAEHEFNASTFTARVIAGTNSDLLSAIAGGVEALKGPKHGGANEVALAVQRRYSSPDLAEMPRQPRVDSDKYRAACRDPKMSGKRRFAIRRQEGNAITGFYSGCLQSSR